jgi:hypothetical protein
MMMRSCRRTGKIRTRPIKARLEEMQTRNNCAKSLVHEITAPPSSWRKSDLTAGSLLGFGAGLDSLRKWVRKPDGKMCFGQSHADTKGWEIMS